LKLNKEWTMDNKIRLFVSSQENQYLEKKSARVEPLDILKHLVAFANADGGSLVIGVEDNGEITGFNNSKARKIEEFKNIALIKLKDSPILPKYEIFDVKNKKGEEDKILVISVEPAYDRVIKSYDNNVYLRQFDKTEKLNHEQITQLEYDRGQRYFEDEVVEDSSIEDIDLELVESYRKNMNLTNSNLEDILEPTKYLPQARLKFVRYDGTKAGVGTEINIIKEITFDKAIPRIITEVKEFIKTQLREFQYLDRKDGNFKLMREYPEFAWFEGVVNALTHRNYSIRGEYIRFIMFDDRIEIQSPGRLPNIVTIENILTQRYSRNPRIARVLSEFGWVKEMNEGVKRIYSEMEKFFLKKPVYSEPGNNVLLVLENNILNRNVRIEDNLKKLINKDIYKKLNLIEKEIIKFSFMNKKITTTDLTKKLNKSGLTTRKYLKKLVELGILEWHGTSARDPKQYYTLKK